MKTAQRDLFFDGPTFEPELDGKRLAGQLGRVAMLMRDGSWRTLAEIAEAVGGSEAGVSARLRDLRKARFSRMFAVESVEGRRRSTGLWEYRVITLKVPLPNNNKEGPKQ
jgi:hypothetical protein